MCEYRDFCSFAHTKEEILINLIDPDNKDANYKINTFKTVWCPYTQEYLLIYIAIKETIARMPTIFKITGETLISTIMNL